MTNEIIRLIKNYLNDFTIETTPNVYNKYQGFTNLLDKNHTIQEVIEKVNTKSHACDILKMI